VFRPDYITVNDHVGKESVKTSWKEFPEENIIITGYPALDRYARLDSRAAETAVRQGLDIPEDMPIVLYCGSVSEDSSRGMVPEGCALGEVIRALNSLDRNVCLITREHPRMRMVESAEDITLWEEVHRTFTKGRLIRDIPSDIRLRLAAARVTISMSPTIPGEVAALRGQHIFMLYPKMRERFEAESGGLFKEPPLVSLGCSAAARNQEELRRLLRQALTADLGLREHQERYVRLDGKNTERVVNFIESLL
jgi:hypothetical protein